METQKILLVRLQDFRMGRMGPVALQLAPDTEVDDGQTIVNITGEHKK